MTVSLCISGTVSHMIVVFGTRVKWWYLQHFFSFSQNSDFSGFSKFINKCQKEILRCAPPSPYVCDFFSVFLSFFLFFSFPVFLSFAVLASYSVFLSLSFHVSLFSLSFFLSFAVFFFTFFLSCLALNIFLSSKSFFLCFSFSF